MAAEAGILDGAAHKPAIVTERPVVAAELLETGHAVALTSLYKHRPDFLVPVEFASRHLFGRSRLHARVLECGG